VAQEQQQQVEKVLKDLEVQNTPQIRVMNKIDLMPEAQRRSLASTGSVVYISAARHLGLDDLLAAIDERMEIDALRPMKLRVPQSEGKLLAQIEARTHILKRAYRDDNVQLEVEAPESLARTLDAYVVKARTTSAVKKHGAG
jgi:GTP-binding protein HflX